MERTGVVASSCIAADVCRRVGLALMGVALFALAGCGSEAKRKEPTQPADTPAASPGETDPGDAIGAPTTPETEPKPTPEVEPARGLPAGPKRLVILGDSISDGDGASDPSRSYAALLFKNDDTSYPEDSELDLTSAYADDFGPVVDVALGGATTGSVAERQLPKVSRALPAPVSGHVVAVMTIGGNDFMRMLFLQQDPNGPGLERVLDNLRRIAAYFSDRERFPDGASLYIANVYDPSDGQDHIVECYNGLSVPGSAAAVRNWDTAYRALGDELGFHVVDTLDPFFGHGFNNHAEGDPELWYADCAHPNDLGHRVLRRLFFEAMQSTAAPADEPAETATDDTGSSRVELTWE